MNKRITLLVAALSLMLFIPFMGYGQTNITLSPGWSRIPYLNTNVMDIGYALSPSNPAVGDVVKSHEGEFSVYTEDGWNGNLLEIEAGKAYHYFSCKESQTTFTYPTTTTLPTITTAAATMESITKINCGGTVTSSGGKAITARGVCWATHTAPSLSDNKTIDGSGVGSFTSLITNLQTDQTYYIRAYATNANGTVYGNEVCCTCRLTGFINGVFSINGDNGKVMFSQGNLQYRASVNVWRFAENQWDFVGCSEANYIASNSGSTGGNVSGSSNHLISSSYDGWMDLYGWGTSGWYCGNRYYLPYHITPDFTYQYGPYGKYDLTGDYANCDWGVYNAISNGGNEAGIWRTLTKAEWDYILNSRSTSSGIRYAKAVVNNVNGVILLPDNWNSSTYSLSNTNNPGAAYTSNTISSSNWTIILEAHGCIFLPAGGYRNSRYHYHVGAKGYYWATTSDTQSGTSAYCIIFTSNSLLATTLDERRHGQLVRLVYPITSASRETSQEINHPSFESFDYSPNLLQQHRDGVNIVINSGWSWIPYLNSEAMEINYAFSAIEPEIGDVVNAQNGQSAIYTENGWTGSLQMLSAGQAYHYYSCKSTSIALSYPSETSTPTVTTAEVTDIILPNASCGGTVTSTGGMEITARGVCWSTTTGPTTSDSKTSDGTGYGSFISQITGLERGMIYYVRAYATYSDGTVYGEERVFTIPTQTGAIIGKFTINSSNEQVCFSQGNLQYRASDSTWRFAESQWDFVGHYNPSYYYDPAGTVSGSDNGEISPTYNGWIDLFNFGTSGYDHGAIYYQPWASEYCAQYDFSCEQYYLPYGSNECNLGDRSGKADWGYNAISNGGNQENLWRTLTIDEWTYVLYDRPGNRYAKAKVNGVSGLILTPDGWDNSAYTLQGLNNAGVNPSTNTIDSTTWVDVLQIEGCVFLPFSGFREGTDVKANSNEGYYWTASYGFGNYIPRINIAAYSINTSYGNFYDAYAVRLVCPVNGSIEHPTLVVTDDLTDITPNSVVCGGKIYASDTIEITARGVCWSTSKHPTTDNTHTSNGTGAGNYVSNITGLEAGTLYFVRAYAVTSEGTLYGEEWTFKTKQSTPTGAVNGMYTINSDGEQILFAQGNLQYQATTNTWRLAEHQYDIIDYYNYYIDEDYDGWIDLFGWGTSGYNHGAVSYQPWSISPNDYDYDAYGDPTKNLYDETGQADWGYNAISNGGNKENLWHTLSAEEWDYVLNDRTTSCGLNRIYAIVNSFSGIILFPDDWDNQIYTFDENTFEPQVSLSVWNNILESTGCIFLPSAGLRTYDQIYGAITYWTSSVVEQEEDYAYCIGESYSSNDFYSPSPINKSYGLAVRLACYPSSPVQVTTEPVTDITKTSAVCGGTITAEEGITITARGLCWSKFENPTLSDSHSSNGTGTGSFTYTLTNLDTVSLYYVRAYASTAEETYYGEQHLFNTLRETPPTGAINGLFTVNKSGYSVYFAKGNLQYRASDKVWQFAANQYDFIGENNNYISPSYNSWIDLFGWGTSGYNHGAYCYQPWSTFGDAYDYESLVRQFFAYGSASYNLYDMTGKADWGYNAISNGGNKEDQWRTLSSEEWKYILFTRETASGNRFVKAMIGEVNGVILFPDAWDNDAITLLSPNNVDVPFNTNEFSIETWTKHFETNGCVFLPAGGYRDVVSTEGCNVFGCYWTSSAIDDWYTDGTFFYDDTLAVGMDLRFSGSSVRLICPVAGGIQHPLVVQTKDVTNITNNSALCGGEISGGNGIQITARGVCWSTEPKPSINGSHTSDGTGLGSFTSSLTDLYTDSIYFVRAYATYGNTTVYGEQKVFKPTKPVPEGAIKGLFSVGDGQQVHFSKGNLQYRATTSKWRFAENQFDVIGTDNANASSDFDGWIDNFCWGTSGYDHGAISYQPWNRSGNPSTDYFAYGQPYANLSDGTRKADWGYNKISNGGNEENLWHTLSNDQWYYLFYSRGTASGLRYVPAVVNNYEGLILFPDDWKTNIYPINTPSFFQEFNNTENTIDLATWESVLEPVGCVFLPCAGDSWQNQWYYSDSDYGYYWSSTASTSYADFAAAVSFHNNTLNLGSNCNRKLACSVRVVCQPNGPLVVETSPITAVTPSSAVCGGNVITENPELITARGVCWSTSERPTLSDSHTVNGLGDGSYTSNITGLDSLTTYFVRAYVSTADTTIYGSQRTFMTPKTQPAGALSGVFTINKDDDQVFFSKGNLQYRASTNTWRFAGNQFDFIGASNTKATSSYNKWIDLFSWGTSNYNHGAVSYRPWSLNVNSTRYHAYGYVDADLGIRSGKADWGYNAISNGGDKEDCWRTMTNDEWDYVLNSRTTSSGILYAKATVNDVPGLILVPDFWSTSIYLLNNFNEETASYTSNIISSGTWTTTFEANGCVFLPAAGERYNKTYTNDRQGYYWSSSAYSDSTSYHISFNDNTLNDSPYKRSSGSSVRLVSYANKIVRRMPSCVIDSITSITSNSALCTGMIFPVPDIQITNYGVCWSTSPSPTIDDNYINAVSGSDTFTISLSNLNASTVYFARAFIITSDTIFYSPQQLFKSWNDDLPEGAVNGTFTCGFDNQRVYFSKGNLQYRASDNKWRFAENQYDFIGNNNQNASSTYNGWIDLFGWGTSGYHDSNDPYNVYYQPWSRSWDEVNEDYNYYGYGPSSNMSSPNLTGESANYDWGVYNPITNGGNQAGLWRTMNYEEWCAIFSREAMEICYAPATIDGVNGLVVLPDDWNTAIYDLVNPYYSYSFDFNDNIISRSDWNTILEPAGCVFLPVAGEMDYGEYYSYSGYYWSTDYYDSSDAYCIYFSNNSFYSACPSRSYACSVRLVQNYINE